ncbi:MAG: hypothetical protein HY720_28855 [Planctomycetes bacterium]|nr:hypothetical protein [Planctomycetota bacterium]
MSSWSRRVPIAIFLALFVAWGCGEESAGPRDERPAPHAPTLDAAARQLADLKKEDGATAGGQSFCCLSGEPCGSCLLRSGACGCAERVQRGEWICAECRAGWLAGRSAFPDRTLDSVPEPTPEEWSAFLLREWLPRSRSADPAVRAVAEAKEELRRTQRYACCVESPRGPDAPAAWRAQAGRAPLDLPECLLCVLAGSECDCAASLIEHGGKGPVCGECRAGWKAGCGAIPGVNPENVESWPAGEAQRRMERGFSPGRDSKRRE